ncbi:Hypothetical predicted protein [Mytilus galloprovincialis]|uniref:Myb/SANT-like DNA-binding domain-containing protein n=1 Tax=Mytilus galloprovincialis TaxID=29158 RepID=A0A8B6DAJ2_MYTGA|nr:Hypothetical predicted protein [Mytilus galloprovincialis]
MAESAEPNPSKLKRLKKTNFTVGEEDLQLVEKHSSIINRKLYKYSNQPVEKKKVWDDIAIKVNSLGVAIRTATEDRNKWRNTTRVAKAVYTTHRSELFKTGGGPAPKQPSSAVEKVIHLMKDTTSFREIQGGLETESFQTNLEDASQDLYESAASLIRDSPPPSSPPSSSLLSGYDPILTQTVIPHIPEQTDRTDKQKTVRTPSKRVTVQDIHDMQYRALQGKIEIQEKQKIQMDFENKLELQIELLQKWMAVQSPLHSHRHLPLCIKCIKFIVILLICISEITMRPTHSFNFV